MTSTKSSGSSNKVLLSNSALKVYLFLGKVIDRAGIPPQGSRYRLLRPIVHDLDEISLTWSWLSGYPKVILRNEEGDK